MILMAQLPETLDQDERANRIINALTVGPIINPIGGMLHDPTSVGHTLDRQ